MTSSDNPGTESTPVGRSASTPVGRSASTQVDRSGSTQVDRTASTLASAPQPETTRRVARWWPLIAGLLALGSAAAGGALLVARGAASGNEIDAEWMAEMVEHRNPVWEVPALVMNFLGAGWFGVYVVPLVAIVILLLLRRWWGAVYFFAATVLSAAAVQALKSLFGRARPVDQLVQSDFGSFPSGHVANAATLAVTLGILLWRTWVWALGVVYTVGMMLSRTYLGVHWLTDTVGGLLVGAAVAVIVWTPLAHRLGREQRAKVATE